VHNIARSGRSNLSAPAPPAGALAAARRQAIRQTRIKNAPRGASGEQRLCLLPHHALFLMRHTE